MSASVGTIADTDNYLGMDVMAQDGRDALDFPECPPINGVTLAFPHREWNDAWSQYTTDIRRLSVQAPQVWNFEVTTDILNAQVQLSWSFSGIRRESLILHDMDSNLMVKMDETDIYAYNSETSRVRHFRVTQE